MAKEGKLTTYANFNITFPEKNEMMLEHFDDIIMPAFLSGLQRGTGYDKHAYMFTDVSVKEFDSVYVLCGSIVKKGVLERRTLLSDSLQIQSSYAKMDTAPFSRFLVFLDAHRMMLVRNEADSPDIRSFQATVKDILKQYRDTANKERENGNKLPYANVNIVEMPLPSDIDAVFRDVDKINWVRWKIFPLNGDKNFDVLLEAGAKHAKDSESHNTYLIDTSPKRKGVIQETVHSAKERGMAEMTLKVTDFHGKKSIIKDDQFSSNDRIPITGDISSADDARLAEMGSEIPELRRVSEENKTLYERIIDILRRWSGKR